MEFKNRLNEIVSVKLSEIEQSVIDRLLGMPNKGHFQSISGIADCKEFGKKVQAEFQFVKNSTVSGIKFCTASANSNFTFAKSAKVVRLLVKAINSGKLGFDEAQKLLADKQATFDKSCERGLTRFKLYSSIKSRLTSAKNKFYSTEFSIVTYNAKTEKLAITSQYYEGHRSSYITDNANRRWASVRELTEHMTPAKIKGLDKPKVAINMFSYELKSVTAINGNTI